MNTYTRLGITIYEKGETGSFPKWALDEDEKLKCYLVDAGAGFMTMPLNSVDATELAADCAAYTEDYVPLSAEDEAELCLYFQDDTDFRIYSRFY